MGRKIFVALIAVLFFYIASPLILTVAMGAVLGVLFTPWLNRLEKRKMPSAWGAGILTLVITLFFVLPISLLVFIGVKAAFQELQALKSSTAAFSVGDGGLASAFVDSPRIHALLERLTQWLPVEIEELTESAQEMSRAAVVKLADLAGQFAAQLPGMIISLAVMVVSFFFFLVDGRRVVNFVRRNSVFSEVQTERLLETLEGTCRSVILASVVSGLAQALIEVAFCVFTGVPSAMLIGCLVFVASFVPVIGSVPITFGVALHQLFLGHNVAGVVLLIGAIIVAMIDNFIRPLFLKGSANLHPLLAFVAAFGGLQTLGVAGVFIGPIIAAVFVVTVQMLTQDSEA